MKQRCALRSALPTVSAILFTCVAGSIPAWSQTAGAPAPGGPPPPPPSAQQLPAPPPSQTPPQPTRPIPAPQQSGPPPGSMPPPPPMEMPSIQAPTPQALATPGPIAKAPSQIVVSGNAAIVNGKPITNQQLVEEYLKDGGQPTINDLIDRTLVDQAAAQAHVSVTPAEVDARLKQAKEQVMTQIWMRQPGLTWAQFLTSQGRSEYYVRQNIRTSLLLEKVLAKKLPPVSLAGKIHIYHILLLTIPMPGHATPHTEADALARIKQIRADIESGKITFQAAAKKYSEDSTSSKGGDLGWVAPNDPLDPDFMKAAQALKEGQISDPVKSRYGYHLIYEQRTGSHATAADIKAETDSQMDARVGAQMRPYLQQLHDTAKIQNLLMPGVPLPPPPAPVGPGMMRPGPPPTRR